MSGTSKENRLERWDCELEEIGLKRRGVADFAAGFLERQLNRFNGCEVGFPPLAGNVENDDGTGRFAERLIENFLSLVE